MINDLKQLEENRERNTDARIQRGLYWCLIDQHKNIASTGRTIIRQHDEIDTLKLRLEIMKKRLKSLGESQLADQKDETPPPHY